MRALVTGSSGFIGKHFASYLDKAGYRVLHVDIRDPEHPVDCRDFFRKSSMKFDLVVHAAAVIPDIDSRGHNAMPVAGNLELDSAMFQWAMRTKPGKTVYFSSSAAYPVQLHSWDRGLAEADIDLDDLQQPNGIYGFTKLAGEIQAREAVRQGLDVLIVRPQSVYGPGQSLSYPFPSFIQHVKDRSDPFEVWGSGQQGRDFIHVDDAVAAIMTMVADGAQGPLNIGSGYPISMLSLAQLVCSMVPEWTPAIECRPEKPQGASCLFADVNRMNEHYIPRVSLEEGIARAIYDFSPPIFDFVAQ